MLSISTYWNSHRHDEDGLHMAYEALLLGFTNMEISHDLSPVLLPGFYDLHSHHARCKSTRMNFTGVRDFCPRPIDNSIAPEYTSRSLQDRERAIELTRKSIDVSADLGGNYVVLSLGRIPMSAYTPKLIKLVSEGHLYSKEYAALKLDMVREREQSGKGHLDLIRQALDQLVPYAQEKGIQLGLKSCAYDEQVPNEREMETLLSEYDASVVGYWHDFGQVQLKHNLGLLDHLQWLKKMLPRLIGCYIHDTTWPAEDHCIPFQGDIDFDQLIPLLPKNIPFVWEIHPRRKSDDIKSALVTWKEKYGD